MRWCRGFCMLGCVFGCALAGGWWRFFCVGGAPENEGKITIRFL